MNLCNAVVLAHFGVPACERAQHISVDTYWFKQGQRKALSKRAQNAYSAIYRSLSLEERLVIVGELTPS